MHPPTPESAVYIETADTLIAMPAVAHSFALAGMLTGLPTFRNWLAEHTDGAGVAAARRDARPRTDALQGCG